MEFLFPTAVRSGAALERVGVAGETGLGLGRGPGLGAASGADGGGGPGAGAGSGLPAGRERTSTGDE